MQETKEIVDCLAKTVLITEEKLAYSKMGGHLQVSRLQVTISLQNEPTYFSFKSLYLEKKERNKEEGGETGQTMTRHTQDTTASHFCMSSFSHKVSSFTAKE